MSSTKLLRRPNGTLLPGQPAINPGGRPKGLEARLRDVIDSQIEHYNGRAIDGWEAMMMVMYDVAMGRKPTGALDMPITIKDRNAAITFIFDRLRGKPTIHIEGDLGVRPGGIDGLNIDNLTKEELRALEAHVELLAAKVEGNVLGRVIDVNPADAEMVPELDPDEVP